jgi:PiT family inorganic phosphate transporter
VWATATTLAGSLLALVPAHGLVETFKGKGLVPEGVTAQPAFLLAVSLGAALTVLLATWTGMPVSTTHALTGGLVGAGLVATSGNVRLSALGSSFVPPVLLSPVAALLLTVLLYPLFRRARRTLGVTRLTCLCVGTNYEEVIARPDGSLALVRTGFTVQTGELGECVERYQGRMLGLEAGPILDGLHYLSGGAVGFARGLNDTPKIVALLLAGETLDPNLGLVLVATSMAVGGVLNARRVAETLSRRITKMNAGQGLTANLVTALMVIAASRLALPVSTTHVAVGSLFGIGMVRGTARMRTILSILLAWATTLPAGAALGAGIYFLMRAA